MILKPREKKKIKEAIEKARKQKGPLTKEQKKAIARKIHKKQKRKAAVIAMFAALGIGTATTVGVVKTLNAGKEIEASEKSKEEEFKEQYKVDNINTQEPEEKNKILKEIVEKYNAQNPDAPINEADLGILYSKPSFLIKQENEDGTAKYIQNYNITQDSLEENQKIVYDAVGDQNSLEEEQYYTDGYYSIVDTSSNKILYTIGDINNKLMEIETKAIRSKENKENPAQEYTEAEVTLKPEFTSEAQMAKFYIDVKEKFQERLQAQNKTNEENER